MSRTIDERVVSMEFDNKQFESNVRTSLSTLDKLKQSLNLKGAAKGLENVNEAAKNCNLSPLSKAADTVKIKFSAMEVMAVTALANITNSAVNAGKKIVKALTIDPVKLGFQEYETQINAVQTILANTQSKGTTLDDVNEALDTLNKYADKTIYNFTEMTRNIGTFTAAGIDLDTAVNAIQGIANLAAVSGSSPQQAATAMYQLSQALASGTVKLMDWNSVVNAGMGGQVFQDALKETARVHGIAIDDMIKKNGSFRETLQEGWLTSEILTETLQKFTLTTEGLTEEQIKANREMLKSKGYTEEQIDEIFKLGQTATDAATKVKTFTQLLDTLKEAAQSGWTQTWELIIGDFEEAKELWTSISDTVGEFINAMSDRRNNLLEGALTSKWDKMIKKINEAGVSTETFNEIVIKTAKEHGYPIDRMIEDYGSLEEAIRANCIPVKILEEALGNLGQTTADLSKINGDLKKGMSGDDIKQAQQALIDLGYDLDKFGVDGIFGSETEAAIKAFQEFSGLEVTGIVDEATLAALKDASTSASDLSGTVGDLINDLDELGGRELLIEGLKNIFEAIAKPIRAIRDAWGETFKSITSEQLYGAIEGFTKFSEKLIISDESAEKIKRTFKGLFAVLSIVKTFIGGGFSLAFKLVSKVLDHFDLNILDVAASAGDALVKFKDWLFENNRLVKGFEKVAGAIADFGVAAWNWIKSFVNSPEFQDKLQGVLDFFTGIYNSVKGFLSGGWKRIDGFIKRFNKLKDLGDIDWSDVFKDFKTNVLGYFTTFDFSTITSKFKTAFSNIKDTVGNLLDKLSEKFGDLKEKFGGLKDKIVEFFSTIKDKLGEHSGSIIAITSLLTLVLLLKKIAGAVKLIARPIAALSGIGESLTAFLDNWKNGIAIYKRDTPTQAIKNIATSMLMMAGAIWIIAQIPPEDLKRAGITMGIMAGALLAMMLITKIIDKIPSKGNAGTNFDGLAKMISKIGIAMLLIAASVKILGSMDDESLTKGVFAAGLFLVAIVGLMSASKMMNAADADKFGKMIGKIATSLLMLSLVVWLFGRMDTKTLIQGGLAVGIFLVGMVGIMKTTRGLASGSKYANEFGKMIRNIAFSLLLLSLVVLIFGKMDTKTLVQGGIAVAAFLGIMIGAMALTKNMSKDVASFGKMMLGISAGLIMMALAVKILGSMDDATLKKGGLAILGFVGVMAILMEATNLMGKYSFNAGKMGLMFLSFAAAILIMTGAIAALSFIEGEKLAKAVAAIAGIGAIFAGLMYVTKYAKNVKGLVGMAIAIAILAASIIALSFIDGDKLLKATLALGSITAVMALLVLSCKSLEKIKAGKALVTLGVMVLVVGALAYIIYKLSDEAGDADKALKVSLALSSVIIALSASAALLAVASKYGPKSFKGAGILVTMVGAVALIAGGLIALALWQLPNIADQLSDFMTKLQPFLAGAKAIDSDLLNNLKILGEAMLLFTGAGSIFAVADIVTLGGVSRAFDEFIKFIKSVVPEIKQLALDVSGDDINFKNLNAIVDAIKGLAEAASNIPNTIFGVFGSKWGGGAVASIANISSFTKFIKDAVPAVKDAAVAVSGSDVSFNADRLTAIVDAIKGLAEAAGLVPTIDIGAAFGKFKGGFGFTGKASWTDFSGFGSFIRGSMTAITNFLNGLYAEDGTSLKKFNEDDLALLTPICEAITILAQAADAAPDIEVFGAFSKFKGGFGVAAGGSIPNLRSFITFIESVVPIMNGFTVDVKASGLTEADGLALQSICKAVEYLGNAAGAAPGITVGAGGGGGGGLFAGGGGGGVYVSVPQLGKFKTWIEAVVPVLSGFALDVKASKLTEADGLALQSICKAVEYLGNAAGAAPGITVGVGAGGGGGIVAGAVYVDIPQLGKFKTWVEAVVPELSGFALDVKASKLTEEDGLALQSICQAATTLATAASDAPTLEVFGSILGGYVSVPQLTEFKNWIADVLPMLSGIASGTLTDSDGNTIPLKDIPENSLKSLTSICNAARILSEAAGLAPTKEEYEGIFGHWVETSDLDATIKWFEDTYDALSGLVTKITENPVDQIALTTLLSVANTAKTLSSAILDVVVAQQEGGYDVDTMVSHFHGVGMAISDFSDEINDIKDLDTNKISSVASAAYEASTSLISLSNFDYNTVDVETFGSKLGALVTAINEFTITNSDISTYITEVTSLADMITGLSGLDISGANALKTALENLGKTSIDKLVKAFTDAKGKVIRAINTMVAESAVAVKSSSNITRFYNSGRDLANGLILGINSRKADVYKAAYALGQKAVQGEKDGQKSHSPSKLTIQSGKWFGEGLVIGIEKMTSAVYSSGHNLGQTAVNSVSATISRISDMLDSDMDTQPTIRPVLDLSEVAAGAGTIGSLFNTNPSVGVLSNVGTISTMMNNRQNGNNNDVISAINELGKRIGNASGNTYQINGITYDDGSNISDAVKTIVRAARVERRI